MKNTAVLFRQEAKEMVRNPAILVVVFLPILMSTVMMSVMKLAGSEFLLLSIWMLFAQVMIGIMLAGPNLVEERETKTIDTLLCSPLNAAQILVAKGGIVFLCSFFSQMVVYFINEGLSPSLPLLLLPMILGGVIFVEIGIVIGLSVNSSKNGSALSAAIMVALFLVVAVYTAVPDLIQKIMLMIPSVAVSEVMAAVLNGGNIFGIPLLIALAWAGGLALVIKKLGFR